MKITQIVASYSNRAQGPSYSIPALCEGLARQGADVTLMSVGDVRTTKTGQIREEMYQHDFAQIPIAKHLIASRQLQDALVSQSKDADVFHAHGAWLMPNVYPARALRKQSGKLVLAPRGMLAPRALEYSKLKKHVFWNAFQKKAFERVSMFHATGQQEFQDIRAFGQTQPVVIIPNGIDIPEVKPVNMSSNGSGRRTALFLARVHPIKRIDLLLEAWSHLQSRFPDWDLKIVGPGPESYVKELKDLANTLRVERVRFEGSVFGAAKTACYQEADLYILPSDSENFAMTVAEALAASTPVITTKGTPWAELESRGCGWWVDHGAAPLEAAMSEAMSHPRERLDDMGRIGRDWMQEAFSWDTIADQMLQAYAWMNGAGDKPDCVQL